MIYAHASTPAPTRPCPPDRALPHGGHGALRKEGEMEGWEEWEREGILKGVREERDEREKVEGSRKRRGRKVDRRRSGGVREEKRAGGQREKGG